jgi:hypothetical protein
VFECIDTKSPNVLVNEFATRISMIDMDPRFCRDSATADQTPIATMTIDDLEARLSGSIDMDSLQFLDSASTSLLIHCIFSISGANDTSRAYGFPYPRVAACIYRNWEVAWHLVLTHRNIDHRRLNAAKMVWLYHHGSDGSGVLDGSAIKSSIAKALRAPMTRILLMTRGLDVNEQIQIARSATTVTGDLYVRLACVHRAGVHDDEEDIEMSAALDAGNNLYELDRLASNRERVYRVFQCRASADKGYPTCYHAPGGTASRFYV